MAKGKSDLILTLTLILLLPQCCHLSSFPIIYTSGTHFQVGYDVGHTFQVLIQEYFSLHPTLHSVLVPWSKSQGADIYNGYLSVVKQRFPQYVEEMQGTARGANVTFREVFLMNLERELDSILHAGEYSLDSCSDILLNYPHSAMIGHNEDASPLIRKRAYLVSVTVTNAKHPTANSVMEQFTYYTYPGILPGNAFGFNAAGLTFSVNALYPKLVVEKRTPRNILTRAMLSSRNVSQLINILEDSGSGVAYGMSVNVGDVHTGEMLNLELAPQSDKMKSLVNCHQVAPHEQTGDNYFHVNMYRRIDIAEIPARVVSSQHRTARIEAMPLPKGLTGIVNILGDTADKKHPIYRQPQASDNGSTVATGIFDLKRCTLAIYLDNPKTTASPFHVLRLPCT